MKDNIDILNLLNAVEQKENSFEDYRKNNPMNRSIDDMILGLKIKNKSISKYNFQKDYNNCYVMSLFDSSVDNPFIINYDMAVRARKETYHEKNPFKKAYRLYEWIYNNISYGEKKRIKGYKNSREVFYDLEGVCGEMSFLYITLARSCGLKSSYVSVTKDYNNESVRHACAVVHLARKVYVDIAYHTFDINHKETEILKDRDVLFRYIMWRNKDLLQK
jgi:transglutaminase-like putative cysteine protease